MNTFRNILGATIALSFAACSSGANIAKIPAAPAKPSGAMEKVSILLVIPKSTAQEARSPRYVSAATKSVSLSVNGAAPVGFNVGTSSTDCASYAAHCVVTVDAPIGVDSFTLSTYDQPLTGTGATQGNLLSTGTASQKIVAGITNSVNMTLNGVVASFTVALPNDTLAAGLASSTPVVVTALDPDGNAIVAGGSYIDAAGNPVTISLSSDNACNCTSLSQTSVTGPDQKVTLSYNGTPPQGVYPTIIATSGPRRATTLAVISGLLTQYRTQGVVSYLAVAPGGNIWFTERSCTCGPFAGYGVLNLQSQALSETPNTAYGLSGIAAGDDGNMWLLAGSVNLTPGVQGSGIMKIPPAGGSGSFLPFPYTDDVNRTLQFSGGSPIVHGPDGRIFVLSADVLSGTLPTIKSETPSMLAVTAAGGFTTFPYPQEAATANELGRGIVDAAFGPDQNLYLVQLQVSVQSGSVLTQVGSRIWKFSPTSGFLGYTSLPAGDSGQISHATNITAGHDGNLWVTAGESTTGSSPTLNQSTMIYKVTSAGSVTPYKLPLSNGQQVVAQSIAAPPGVYQWAIVGEAIGGTTPTPPAQLARIDSSGNILYVPLRTTGGPCDAFCGGSTSPMIVGSDGNLYAPNDLGFARIQY